MKMLELIRETIINNATLFGFSWDGKDGNIDPIYLPEGDSFLLFFDGKEQRVHSFDAVIHTPFVEGHSLAEIAEQLTVTEL